MKKLFTTGSSVMVEEYSSVQINGPYSLMKLGPDFAAIKSGEYVIEAHGSDLLVDTLSEEVAVLTFTSITSMSIVRSGNDGTNHAR